MSRRPMALAERRFPRQILLCLLYFSQGVPWGLATIALLGSLSQAGLGGYGFDAANFYVLAGLSPVVPLLLLMTLDPDGVERRKRDERGGLVTSVA